MQVTKVASDNDAKRFLLFSQDDLKEVNDLSITIVLLPGFSFFSYQAFWEPLSLIYSKTGSNITKKTLVSVDGSPVLSADGCTLNVDCSLSDVKKCDLIVLCGGPEIYREYPQQLLGWLRQPHIRQKRIGAIDSACVVLMESGLLNGHRCTVHWRHETSAKEMFPKLEINQMPYEIDRNRFTGAGGLAALNLALKLIEQYCGERISSEISAYYNHGAVPTNITEQKNQLTSHYAGKNQRLMKLLNYIKENLEDELSCEELAKYGGMSRRQMERTFRRYFNVGPAKYIVQMRLLRSLDLLQGSNLSISEISYAAGFSSPSHFSKRFRDHFGTRPSDARLHGIDNLLNKVFH